MTRQHPELPQGYTAKGRWYYRVRPEGKKRVWVKISLVADGLPAFYQELSRLGATVAAPDRIPALVADWQAEVMPSHAKKTQENDRWAMGAIAAEFAEFRASEVTTPLCLEFLKDYRDRPRTHNLMRQALLELMRYAEGKANMGAPYRPPNSNPVASIKRMSTPARDRYPTDSEVRRIKCHAIVGRDGNRTRSGPMLAALIDLAYLTGQRVGDLLDLRWHKLAALQDGEVVAPYIAKDGLHFKPSKTEKSTGAKVLIRWTPRLKEVVERIKTMDRKKHPAYVLTNQDGAQLLYSTFATAWWRACDRAGIKGLHFHDLRAKAITDTKRKRGIADAQIMGAHSTEGQTKDYVRDMEAQETEATR
jgi:integrase